MDDNFKDAINSVSQLLEEKYAIKVMQQGRDSFERDFGISLSIEQYENLCEAICKIEQE
jgi:hypothetical protein